MWLLSMLLSSYDTHDGNMTTHLASMIFSSSKIRCHGRDSPWLSRLKDFCSWFPKGKNVAPWHMGGRPEREAGTTGFPPAGRTEYSRIQSMESHLALLVQLFIYIYTNLYLIHLLCMPSFILVGSLALCSLLKNVNDSKGFSSCGKDTLQELMFATDVLCARGPRKRTRSQSTEGSRAGGPFLA